MVNKLTIYSYLQPFLYLERNEFIHLSKISRIIGKNHTVARLHLRDLEKQGIIEKKIIGRLSMYRIKENFRIIHYLSITEKEKLILQCQKDIILGELVDFLTENLNQDNKAIIFGSATKDARKAGDADLIITGKINEEKIRLIEKKLNIKLHILNVKNFDSINKTLKKEILLNHLIIQGVEEIVKWLI